MKKILNDFLLRFKEDSLNKRLRNVNRQAAYKDIKEIKKCLVFWCAHADQNEWIRQLKESFPGVQLDQLCFVADRTAMLETDELVVIRKEDLGFGGKIRNGRLFPLLERKYDLFIDLTPETTVLIKYVLLRTQAACIVGMKKEEGMADIIVDEVAGPLPFISKLKEILSGINKY